MRTEETKSDNTKNPFRLDVACEIQFSRMGTENCGKRAVRYGGSIFAECCNYGRLAHNARRRHYGRRFRELWRVRKIATRRMAARQPGWAENVFTGYDPYARGFLIFRRAGLRLVADSGRILICASFPGGEPDKHYPDSTPGGWPARVYPRARREKISSEDMGGGAQLRPLFPGYCDHFRIVVRALLAHGKARETDDQAPTSSTRRGRSIRFRDVDYVRPRGRSTSQRPRGSWRI